MKTIKREWPYNYEDEGQRRDDILEWFESESDRREIFEEEYANNPISFIQDWCYTYNPRNVGTGIPVVMPFLLFKKQREMVRWLQERIKNQDDGLCEKSRDMGATWLCVAYSVWLWRFHDGASVGWGSRKQDLVDRIGDPDSIFEKIRIILRYLPAFALPLGFKEKEHSHMMRLVNPENGASITGEVGDNIGRGGRKLIYFKDESSHYERPEKIEAALGDNTNIQIDISSVNGIGNVFYRRRFGGYVSVFVMDWRDHPGKTQEWYDKRREKAEAEGLLHLFAQEVDRDYGASVEGIVIPSAWVNSAVDAHERLNLATNGNKFAGLDVADEGGDKNAVITRTGMILDYADMWGEGDTGKTTRKAIFICRERKIKNLQYDCIGVGSGVKSEINRLKEVDEEQVDEENVIPDGLVIVPWNAGKSPLNPDDYFIEDDDETPLNKNLFKNLKSQGWWQLRLRFERTHKAVTEGLEFDHEDLISISSKINHFNQLKSELSQPTYTLDTAGRIMINKKPSGTNSPNLADGVVECYWPVPGIEVIVPRVRRL